MAVNYGIAPPDMSSLVGQFRANYGDMTWVELTPVEPGFGDYEELSDAEIEGFLIQGRDSVSRSIGFLYLAMAGKAAFDAKSYKNYDDALDKRSVARELRETARFWFDRADDEDLADGVGDIFEIYGHDDGGAIPEMTMPIYGRHYTWGEV